MIRTDEERNTIADALASIACLAGGVITTAAAGGFQTKTKPDGSPATSADVAAEAIILAELARHFPGIPVLAEEGAEAHNGLAMGPCFFLVDPLDGTRDFVDGGQEFTVNIALIEGGRPQAGVVHAPALNRIWIGGATTKAADTQGITLLNTCAITVRPPPEGGWTALTSARHGDAASEIFLARLPLHERKHYSSSLKFCMIAEGKADIYARFGPTMEWDTAAGDAVLSAAGGSVTDQEGRLLAYGKAECGFVNGPFIGWGDPSVVSRYITQRAAS